MASPRLTLFVKKHGTCPFSQRAYMFLSLRLPRDQFVVKEIDIQNKPKEFLELNPEGKVPVLVDHGADNKVVTDSAVIVQYVDDTFGKKEGDPDLACGHQGECVSAGADVFSAFAKFMKNKDPELQSQFKENLLAELKKFNDYLEKCGSKYLVKDHLTEPDCTMLPRINQIRVAGPKLKDFSIPQDFAALWRYIESGQAEQVWKDTCPLDENVGAGWAAHM